MTTAAVVNGSWMPNQRSNKTPTKPRRPNAVNSATPPTTGGSTSGRVTSARTRRWPGKRVRARTNATGTPNSRHTAVVMVAVMSDNRSAVRAPGSVSRAPSVDQGALMSRPISGRNRYAVPITAGSSSTHGGRRYCCCDGWVTAPGSRPRSGPLAPRATECTTPRPAPRRRSGHSSMPRSDTR